MRPKRLINSTYCLLATARWIFGLATALVAGALKANPARWWLFAGVLVWVQANAWYLVFLCPVCVVLAEWGCVRFGSPGKWKIIQSLLDDLQAEVFEGGYDGPLQDHRVTLFKHAQWKWWMRSASGRLWPWGKGRWPWSGWLVPVARSGHTTQRSSTVFLAPDDANKAEGIAGMTWARRKPVSVDRLPRLTEDSPVQDLRTYAVKGSVDLSWVQARVKSGRLCARSFCGIPVEVKGQLWGVIVIDSASERLPDSAQIDRAYRLVGRFLGVVLQEAK
jgi:hypothetical protein